MEWYADNNITKSLKEKFMSPGLPLFAGRLLKSFDNCAIKCRADKSTWKSPVLTHMAFCYDTFNMSQVGCGKLFGGKVGSCPKYGMDWRLHSNAQQVGNEQKMFQNGDLYHIVPWYIPFNFTLNSFSTFAPFAEKPHLKVKVVN